MIELVLFQYQIFMIEFNLFRYQIFIISLICVSTEIPAYNSHVVSPEEWILVKQTSKQTNNNKYTGHTHSGNTENQQQYTQICENNQVAIIQTHVSINIK